MRQIEKLLYRKLYKKLIHTYIPFGLCLLNQEQIPSPSYKNQSLPLKSSNLPSFQRAKASIDTSQQVKSQQKISHFYSSFIQSKKAKFDQYFAILKLCSTSFLNKMSTTLYPIFSSHSNRITDCFHWIRVYQENKSSSFFTVTNKPKHSLKSLKLLPLLIILFCHEIFSMSTNTINTAHPSFPLLQIKNISEIINLPSFRLQQSKQETKTQVQAQTIVNEPLQLPRPIDPSIFSTRHLQTQQQSSDTNFTSSIAFIIIFIFLVGVPVLTFLIVVTIALIQRCRQNNANNGSQQTHQNNSSSAPPINLQEYDIDTIGPYMYNSKDQCVVCLEQEANIRTHCGHLFHPMCLRRWFKKQINTFRKPTCPVCVSQKTNPIKVYCLKCKIGTKLDILERRTDRNYVIGDLGEFKCQRCTNGGGNDQNDDQEYIGSQDLEIEQNKEQENQQKQENENRNENREVVSDKLNGQHNHRSRNDEVSDRGTHRIDSTSKCQEDPQRRRQRKPREYRQRNNQQQEGEAINSQQYLQRHGSGIRSQIPEI